MPHGDKLRLADQLCFALYAATNAITRSYRGMLGELGLTYPQYLVVMTLLETPSMTSGDLARKLRLDAGTLTPMLKRLAAAGLIQRTRRPDDERVIDNQLTPAGLALRGAMERTRAEVQYRTGMDDMGVAELRERLHDLTTTLGQPLEQEDAAAETTARPHMELAEAIR
jgi:DNA-binding MarR family transcriptional regulator